MEVSREHINTAAEAVHAGIAAGLGGGCDNAQCAAACRRLAGAVDAEVAAAKDDGAPVACVAGCDFCCHQRVSVFLHEAVALLGNLRARASPAEAAALEQRLRENARRVDGMTVREHYAANLRCAFLVDGRCSAYEVRPSACAAYHSLSRERCEYSYNHPQDIGTPKNRRPALLTLTAYCDAVIGATESGLAAAGLSSAKAELHQALRALLDDPRAVERWPIWGEPAGGPAA